MARKKKNDFWDDVEDLNTVSDNAVLYDILQYC